MMKEEPEITEELKKISLSRPTSADNRSNRALIPETKFSACVEDGTPTSPHEGHSMKAEPLEKDSTNLLKTLMDQPRVLADGVEHILHRWLDGVMEKPKPSIFDGRTSVTIECFIDTLVTMFQVLKVDHCLLLPVIINIKRLIEEKKMVVTWGNIHRMILASTLVSMKFYFDEQVDNCDFAKMIGLQCSDVNHLEAAFLASIEYELVTKQEEYCEFGLAVLSASTLNHS